MNECPQDSSNFLQKEYGDGTKPIFKRLLFVYLDNSMQQFVLKNSSDQNRWEYAAIMGAISALKRMIMQDAFHAYMYVYMKD